MFFSNADKNKGDVLSYDLKSGQSTWLNAKGRAQAAVPSRETVYLPESDLVLLAARTRINDRPMWLAYDCPANSWRGLELTGDDPIGKGTSGGVFHNSVGMMYDPNRKLVWFAGQNSNVHTLRLIIESVKSELLE